MKTKVLFTSMLLASSMAVNAQTVTAEQVSELKQKVESLQQQITSLSERLSGVEQLNLSLRKALDFGQGVAEVKGTNGVTYKVTSIDGDIQTKTITVNTQIVSTEPNVTVAYNFSSKKTIVDIYGNMKSSGNNFIAEQKNSLTLTKNVPVNGKVIFYNIENITQSTQLKLITLTFTNNGKSEVIEFKDLQVDWK